MCADRTRQFYKGKNVLETSFLGDLFNSNSFRKRSWQNFYAKSIWMMEQNTF
jgi:hypothetical protein